MIYILVLTACALVMVHSFMHRRGPDGSPSPGGVSALALSAILGVVAAVRYGIGTDYAMYELFYEHYLNAGAYADNIANVPQEAGYTVLATFAKTLGLSAPQYLGAVGALVVILFFLGARRHAKGCDLAMVLFVLLCFYSGSFNYVRQGVAMGIVFVAFARPVSRTFGTLMLVLLAGAFHSSALIAGLVLICLEWLVRHSRRPFVYIVTGVLAIGLVMNTPWVMELATALNPRYGEYLSESESGGLGAVFILLSRGVCLIAVLVLASMKNASFDLRRLVSFGLVGMGVLLASTELTVVVRFEYYFGMFWCLALPAALHERRRGPLVLVVALLGLAVYYGFHVVRFDGVFPYQAVWSR